MRLEPEALGNFLADFQVDRLAAPFIDCTAFDKWLEKGLKSSGSRREKLRTMIEKKWDNVVGAHATTDGILSFKQCHIGMVFQPLCQGKTRYARTDDGYPF